jgi:hypothetical protein
MDLREHSQRKEDIVRRYLEGKSSFDSAADELAVLMGEFLDTLDETELPEPEGQEWTGVANLSTSLGTLSDYQNHKLEDLFRTASERWARGHDAT